jgi:hypothetical protein
MKYLRRLAALHNKKSSAFLASVNRTEKQMSKMTLVSAALIAATVFATQATAARNDVTARQAMKAHAGATGCVRAPDVGAFASAPYIVPPCLPNNAADALQ